MKLYTLTSPLHSETVQDASQDPFINAIEAEVGRKFLHRGDDFGDFAAKGRDCDGKDYPGTDPDSGLSIVFVRTGGTEGLFQEKVGARDAILLSSGESNSLAAAMEILSWLRRNGCRGEILHGSPEKISARLVELSGSRFPGGNEPGSANDNLSREESGTAVDRWEFARNNQSTASPRNFLQPLPPIDLGGMRLGVIGRPSDWLISSDVDYAAVKAKFNAELVDIPMTELLDAVRIAAAAKGGVDLRSFTGSEAVYDALKAIVARERLSGLTIRCFDLLDTVHNTGCLALARLNAEGVPSSCEGDIPALLTMAWLQKEKGCPGFQCNLSRIEGDCLLFAHCTVPLTMVSSYAYATHFESGIGTAIKGEMPEGDVEIVKIAPDLEHYVSIPGRLTANHSFRNLCRTQITVEAQGAAGYFLRTPCANHHIVSYR